MKLLELRQKVHEAWERLNSFKGILVQAEQFKVEMKQFGDLRRKDTWSKTLARFEALNIYKSCLDAYCLIINDFNFTPDRWDYEFRYQIVDEFLMMPDGIDMIRLGLEQLFSSTFTPQEREEAHGFFELVAEQGSRNGLPVGLVRQLSGTSATGTLERMEMWRRAFPPQVPTQGLDIEKLAQLNATGASIRNIALSTTFLAAVANEPVTMYHLLDATRQEMKIGYN